MFLYSYCKSFLVCYFYLLELKLNLTIWFCWAVTIPIFNYLVLKASMHLSLDLKLKKFINVWWRSGNIKHLWHRFMFTLINSCTQDTGKWSEWGQIPLWKTLLSPLLTSLKRKYCERRSIILSRAINLLEKKIGIYFRYWGK